MNLITISSIPNWLLFIIFPLTTWAILGLLIVLFRYIAKRIGCEHFDGEILNTATSNVVSGAYVILGFVLVLVLTAASDIDSNLSKEASHIEGLDLLLVIEGSPASEKVRHSLHSYTRSIVTDEWARLAGGEKRNITRQKLESMFVDLSTLQRSSTKREALLADIMESANQVVQYRNLRILASQSRLPSLFWHLSYLTLLGVIVIAALRLIRPSGTGVLALIIQLTTISWLFATVMILDLPYLGEHKVSPEAFERAIQLMEDRQTLKYFRGG